MWAKRSAFIAALLLSVLHVAACGSVVFKDSSGARYTGGSYGLDRQWFQAPSSGSLTGTVDVYAEDGITLLGSGSVTLTAGKSYRLVVSP